MVTDIPTSDPEVIVEIHRNLIAKLLESPEAIEKLSGNPMQVGIILSDPDVSLILTLDGANTTLTQSGESDPDIDPTIQMSWETAHKFWLGNMEIMSAVFTGKVRLQGKNMDPLFRMKGVVDVARKVYSEIINDIG